ncbi:MAG: oligosaccharide flippase family protein [Chlorobiaceae bacterium]|nr:oligosaccharide flippase family protein [Chlorobiaceae bacterium]NTW74813.1 oligosaccharide flippase family protein [Chlorobiaceae bacterium]
MKQERTIARQAGISMAGFAFGQVVRFGYNLAAARLLGADALGIYALVVAVMQVGEVVAVAGLDAALLRFANQHEGDPRKRSVASAMKMGLTSALVVSALLLMLSGRIAAALHGGELLRLVLCSAAAAIPVTVTTLLAGHAAQAFRNLAPKVVATQMVAPLALLALMIGARYLSGVEAALIVPFVPSAMLALATVLPGFRRTTGVGSADLLHAPVDRAMLSVAMPLLAVALFGMFSHWIDIMMLGLLTDTRTVGLYQPAARTAGLLRSVFLAFSGIAAPMIAACHARGDSAGIRRLYDLVSRWVLTLSLLPALLFTLYSREALSIFGAGFPESSTALVLLTVAALMQAWFGLGSTVLAMAGGERLSLVNQTVALLLQVGLHLILIPRYGMDGAAISSLAVTLLLSLARAAEMRLLLGIGVLSRKLWKPLLAAFLTGAALVMVKSALSALPPLAAFAAGAACASMLYVALMGMFRLEEEELEVIFSFIPFLKKTTNDIT